MYGCGDLVNDYEEIQKADPSLFPHVNLGYSLDFDARGRLQTLDVEMFSLKALRLTRITDQAERRRIWRKLQEISAGL